MRTNTDYRFDPRHRHDPACRDILTFMSASKPPEERAARSIVEANSDRQLSPHDDGSEPSMVDYLVQDRTGIEIGVLEVGRIADTVLRAARAAYWKHSSTVFDDAALTSSWAVFIEPHTQMKRLWRYLKPLIVEMQTTGTHDLSCWQADVYDPTSLSHRLSAIGVRQVSAVPTPTQSAHVVSIALGAGSTSPIYPNDALTLIELWLSADESDQRGIRTKVTSTLLPERHVFLWIDHDGGKSAHYFVQHDEPPSRPPNLPSGFTDLWLASDSHMGWHWNASTSWTRFKR